MKQRRRISMDQYLIHVMTQKGKGYASGRETSCQDSTEQNRLMLKQGFRKNRRVEGIIIQIFFPTVLADSLATEG